MPGGACCVLGVCCPPDRQAAALAEHLGVPLEAAQAIAGTTKGAGYLLIPRTLPEAMPNGDTKRDAAFAEAARQRLERLNRYAKAEMKAILIDLGHPVEASK